MTQNFDRKLLVGFASTFSLGPAVAHLSTATIWMASERCRLILQCRFFPHFWGSLSFIFYRHAACFLGKWTNTTTQILTLAQHKKEQKQNEREEAELICKWLSNFMFLMILARKFKH